jgi:ATP-binding cassette subfamily F protein uup
LANAGKAVIFVTHDRYFLDAVATKIIEIERTKLFYYEGNYSAYIRGKLIRATDNKRKETRRQAQLKKELDWLNRGAKARTSKPKDHIDRVKELLSKSYLISHQDLDISFQIDRLGKTILELHRLGKSYSGKVLFTDIDHNFQNMERVGIIGPNGCGKTTLLKIIVGEEKPDNGTVKTGINTHFAYYKQDEDSFDPNLTVYEYIAQFAEVIKNAEGNKVTATEMLKRFLFDGKMQQMKLGALSGGERKRLYLLKALMFGANFIIMDEPTNDLDIRTLEILEDYMDAFKGCLLIVSHDRFFLDRTVDYLFIFQDGKLRKFAGNYSDYLLVKRFEQDATEEKKEPVITRPKRIAKGLSYNEQREFGLLEKEIEKIESELLELESRLNDFAKPLSPNDYYHISISMQELENRHQELLTRWLELSDKQNAGN